MGTAVVAVDAASVTGHTGVLASVGQAVLDARMGREAFAGGDDGGDDGGVGGGGSGIVSRATAVTVASGDT